jgi:hypothetical protein
MAVPDLIAGLVYGLTGDNNLTEIEACYQGGVLMENEIVAGIAYIKKGGWDYDVQAGLEFGLVALQIPQALHTCEGMGDDIAAIESWAQIFTNPAELAATLSKHYLLHKKEINADIALVTSEWDAAEYFQTGVALAQLLTDAIGPIETPLPGMNPYNPVMIPQLVAGWIYQTQGQSYAPFADQQSMMDYFVSCFYADPQIATTMQTAEELIDTGVPDQEKEGAQMIFSLMPLFKSGFEPCTQESTQINAIFSYFNYVETMNPDQRFTMAVKNLRKNYGTISSLFG